MEPIRIICTTCAAKLKATDPSAIGQRLGCPRCGTMNLVKAPPGMVSESGPIVSESFDEIDLDSLLKPDGGAAKKPGESGSNRPSPKNIASPPAQRKRSSEPKTDARLSGTGQPETRQPRAKQSRAKQPEARPPGARQPDSRQAEGRHGAGRQTRGAGKQAAVPRPVVAPVAASAKRDSDAATESPMVPDGQWVSPQSKKNRQLLLVVASIAGSILVLSVVILALFQSGDDPLESSTVVQADPDGQLADNPSEAQGIASQSSSAKGPVGSGVATENKLEAENLESENLEAENLEAENLEAETGAANDSNGLAAEEKTDVPPTVEMPAPEIEVPAVESKPGDLAVAEQPGDASSDANPDDANSEIEAPVADVDNEKLVEDSSSLGIEGAGVSLLEARDAASLARVREAPGRPKYFVEKRIPDRLNIEKQKQLDIPGVIYDGVTLQRALHELSDISGVSLSVEAPMFRAASLEINPKLSIKVEKQNVTEIVNRIANQVGAKAVATDAGFVLMPLSSDNLIIERIDTSAVNNVARVEVELMLRKLVYPEGWVSSDEPGLEGNRVRFIGKTLEVSAPAAIVSECKELVAARFAVENGQPGGEQAVFEPFADLSVGKFAEPFKPFNSIRVPIGTLLEEFRDKYGVTVMGDWNRLRPLGWSVQAMAPSSMQEGTVGQAIAELAHALDAAVFVLDEQTAWLTTFDAATSYFFVKMYSISDVAGGKLSGRQIVDVIERSIGRELRLKGVDLQLVADEKYLAVRAPQFLHRQIVAVMESLIKR